MGARQRRRSRLLACPTGHMIYCDGGCGGGSTTPWTPAGQGDRWYNDPAGAWVPPTITLSKEFGGDPVVTYTGGGNTYSFRISDREIIKNESELDVWAKLQQGSSTRGSSPTGASTPTGAPAISTGRSCAPRGPRRTCSGWNGTRANSWASPASTSTLPARRRALTSSTTTSTAHSTTSSRASRPMR